MPRWRCATGSSTTSAARVPDAAAAASRRDRDAFDAVADHLLVVDHAIGPGPEGVVATYRLIRAEAAARLGRFYSADEYDISPVVDVPRPGHGTRPFLRRIRTTATAPPCSCCGAASPPMCSCTTST